ncbi:hypothetical protein [Mucisphaera sp.]
MFAQTGGLPRGNWSRQVVDALQSAQTERLAGSLARQAILSHAGIMVDI